MSIHNLLPCIQKSPYGLPPLNRNKGKKPSGLQIVAHKILHDSSGVI